MQSDIDGDGRTLAQEIFVDGTDPFEADTPTPVTSHQKGIELEQ